jgi:hypothetical protein
MSPRRTKADRRRRAAVAAAGAVALETIALRAGPGALRRQGSTGSPRLGWWRVQRCPVGAPWSLVSLVKGSELTEEERRAAREAREIRIP